MTSKSIIQSYVYPEGKPDTECYMVSTIERDSSAAAHAGTYFETIVWKWDTKTRQREDKILLVENSVKTLTHHQVICETIFLHGIERLCSPELDNR